MLHRFLHLSAVVTWALVAGGCANLPREHGRADVSALVAERTGAAVAPVTDAMTDAQIAALVAERLAQPLDIDAAVQIAFLRNPRLQSEYARLGIARADLREAARLSNPTFSYARLDSRGGGHEVSMGIVQSFADLLLLPARKRIAAGEFLRNQQLVAAALIELATDVHAAWFEYVTAKQVAALRGVVSRSAEASADVAQRFFDAGNVTALQLKLEQAAFSQARLELLHAGAEATRARLTLNTLMGLSGDEAEWRAPERLPAPVAEEDSLDALLAIAGERRLDLAAARQEVRVRQDLLATTGRWRWLGSVDIGFLREDEGSGDRAEGPSVALQLPIFNQGQGAIARATAFLDDAHAQVRLLELEATNAVRLGVERIIALRTIAEQYRTALIPQREAIVARTQERVNFMLVGVFELLVAKQQEYDAYQGYLESIRDYWLARVDLARAIGERLPSDATISEETLGVDEIVTPPADPGMDQGAPSKQSEGNDMRDMDHSQHQMPKQKEPEAEQRHDHNGDTP